MKSGTLPSIAILLLFTCNSNAQIQQGKTLLGGMVNYSSTTPTYHSFYGNLQAGKILKKQDVFGLMVNYSSNNSFYTMSHQYKTRAIGAGLFYRKYKSLGNKFFVFGEVNAGYSHSKYNMEYFNGANQSLFTKSDLGSLYLIPGISYSLCKKAQIELSMPNIAYISYRHSSTIDSNLPAGISPEKKNEFTASASLSANLLQSFGIGFKLFL